MCLLCVSHSSKIAFSGKNSSRTDTILHSGMQYLNRSILSRKTSNSIKKNEWHCNPFLMMMEHTRAQIRTQLGHTCTTILKLILLKAFSSPGI